MFTQCPTCQTIFKLSAETLRAAAGEVRCGRCGEEFNALSSLAEEPQAFTAARVALPEMQPQAPVPATTSTATSAPAISSRATPVAEDPEDHQTIADDPSLAFTLPPGELDRIFVEARPHHFAPRRGPLALSGLEDLEPTDTHAAVTVARSGAAVPVSVLAPQMDRRPAQATAVGAIALPAPVPIPAPHPAATPAVIATAAPVPAPVALAAPAAPAAAAESAVPVEAVTAQARAQWIEQILPPRLDVDFGPPRETHRGRWIAAAGVLAVILIGQLVNRYRDTLAQIPVVGAPLRSLYALSGRPIEPKMNLAAFEIRPWGVTGDTTADGMLHVRASLINNGADPQPYPLLRLKLEDRFGAHVGSRDFQPAEYLHKTPQRPLGAGERADLLVDVVDPGNSAQGFELDVCERQSSGGVICANDAPATGRPRTL